MDYEAIARAISDPENQPHQWTQLELAQFFTDAADEIERLREALKRIAEDKDGTDPWQIAENALQQKDSE